jgi:glycosyltransferase involved in cell wall biosynthesis
VSVVVPTYNRADLLSKAVDSALGQTYEDIELIVVDDGSSDCTLDMLAGYADPRLRVVSLDHSGIPGKVRNAGVRVARGEFVAFLDSDDIWLPTKLERQVEVLMRSPTVGLVCSNARVIDDHGAELDHRYLAEEIEARGTELEELLRVNFIINSSAIVRRTLVEAVGCFSESSDLRALEDYDLWLRIAAASEVAYLPDALILYREHPGSVRRDAIRREHLTGLLTIMDNFEEALHEDDRKLALIRARRAELLVRLAVAQRAEVGLRAAVRSLLAAMKVDPGAAASILLIRPILHLTRWAEQGATALVRRRSAQTRGSSEAQR